MKKRYTKNLGKFQVLLVCAICTLVVSQVLSVQKGVQKVKGDLIELSYKASSPAGPLGGIALPASCESGAWNANSGYHLDGVTSDPGNCATVANRPPVMTHLTGTIKVPVNQNVGSWDALATDPDGDHIYYEVNWGDTIVGTTGVVNSNTNATLGHVYTKIGTYTIKARATETSNPVAFNWTDLFSTKAFAQPEGLSSGWTDFTVEVYDGNLPPETPTITGDAWAIVGQPTANYIVSNDPENDTIFYEIDWNGSGSVDGTTGDQASGANTPIGHIYDTPGTYTVKGRAVQSNDHSKISGWGSYTIRVTTGACSAPANACGATNGTIQNGQCVAPGLPAGYGESCAGPANVCNMTTGGGTIGCDGTCSDKTAPSNTLCGCTSTANICGMTTDGKYNAAGTTCLATAPSNTLCTCNSAENACGMTAPGNYNAAGTTCMATIPSDDLCPAPGVGTVINDFRASPKLLAINKTSKLYWDISGNRRGCTITYTKTPGGSVTTVVPLVGTNVGQVDTTAITEKRYYHLTCGAVEKEAVVSPYSLTEI